MKTFIYKYSHLVAQNLSIPKWYYFLRRKFWVKSYIWNREGGYIANLATTQFPYIIIRLKMVPKISNKWLFWPQKCFNLHVNAHIYVILWYILISKKILKNSNFWQFLGYFWIKFRQKSVILVIFRTQFWTKSL